MYAWRGMKGDPAYGASMNSASTVRLAAIVGFLGVALGAFGAHGLEDLLIENGRVETWETAVLYHLVHAAVLLAIGLRPNPPKAPVWCFGLGILLFSGSLYILSVTNLTWLGATVTPTGGVVFLVAWALLLIRPPREAGGR